MTWGSSGSARSGSPRPPAWPGAPSWSSPSGTRPVAFGSASGCWARRGRTGSCCAWRGGLALDAARCRSSSVRPMTMQTRPLGRTGADVTILGYGAMELRGQPVGPAIADDDAGRLLNLVLDSGISLIDTSIDYGRSEELIGRYLGHRRDEYFLASKCGCLLEPPPDARPPFPHDYSAR